MNKKYSMVALLVGLVSALQANEKKEEFVAKQSYALSAPAKAIVGIGSALALVGGLYYWQAPDVKKEAEQDDSGDETSFNENEQQEEVLFDDVDKKNKDDFYQEVVRDSLEYFEKVASNIWSKAHSASLQAEQRFNDLKGYLNGAKEYYLSDEFKESVAQSVENVSKNVDAAIDSAKFVLKKVSEKGAAAKKLLLTPKKKKKLKKVNTEPYRFAETKEFEKKIKLKMKEEEQRSSVLEKKEEPVKVEEHELVVKNLTGEDNNGTEGEDNNLSVDEVLQPQLDQYDEDVSPAYEQVLQESNLSFEKQSTNSVSNNTKYAVGGVGALVVLGILYHVFNR